VQGGEDDEDEVEEIAAPEPKPRFDPGKSTRSVDPAFQANQEERYHPVDALLIPC